MSFLVQIIVFINIYLVNSFSIYPRFFNNPVIYDIDGLLNKIVKQPIILNGNKTPLKKDLCRLLCEKKNINFLEYTFDEFMLKMPHLANVNKMIYVSDFLIGNGRILNHFETETLYSLQYTQNLIVFQTDNINNIPFKDNNIVRHFPIYHFPKISDKELIRYIYDAISIHNYDDELYLYDWIKYDIHLLNLEQINILLFEVNNLVKESDDLTSIDSFIYTMILSFD
jgi:hypothetical protein